MVKMLDAVINLKDNFTDTLQTVEKNLGQFSRTAQRQGKAIEQTGYNLTQMGGKLTKGITLPVLGATTAVGGLVAALGWGRLTGLDNAQAQLKGLGYTTEEVEKISETVGEAVDGTLMTMAEGTSVAAGALAAGIEEGDDLERYIGLVGDAAAGANRPVNEMATIFNRVQGTGKLFTQELNQIEDALPGFSNALADELGVSYDEMRELVSNGEVTADEFLKVMDDFAGGMSAAQAETFDGMFKNVKANIGKIGELLLGGVFEQSKEAMSEFLALLKSDEARAWAEEVGEKIGTAFSNIVDKVKEAIEWWQGLDDETKGMIGKLAAMVVAAGPAITVIGKITQAVGDAVLKFGKFSKALKGGSGIIGALLGPGGKVVLVILAIVAVIILAIRYWDEIKEAVTNAKEAIENFLGVDFSEWGSKFQEAFGQVKERLKEAGESFGPLKEALQELGEKLAPIAESIMTHLGPVLGWIAEVFVNTIITSFTTLGTMVSVAIETINGILTGLLDMLGGIIDFVTGVFTGDWELAWSGAQQISQRVVDAITSAWEGLKSLLSVALKPEIDAVTKAFHEKIDKVKRAWEKVKEFLQNPIQGTVNLISRGVDNIRDRIGQNAQGTPYWRGGPTYVHERGAEIIDLPRGSRVIPHDKSLEEARIRGRQEAGSNGVNVVFNVNGLTVREEADVDKIARTFVRKIEQANINMA